MILAYTALSLIILLIPLGKNDYNYVSPWKKAHADSGVFVCAQFCRYHALFKGTAYRQRGDVEGYQTDSRISGDGAGDERRNLAIFSRALCFMGILLFLLIRDET